MAHPAVKAAVVTAIGERTHKRLVAYVVPARESQSAAAPGRAASLPDAVGSDGDGLLLDPIERLEFKLRQPGLRPTGTNSQLQLNAQAVDEEVCLAFNARASHRTYSEEPISFEQLSTWLGCLRQIDVNGLPKYRYGSAGGLYPVQAYLVIKPGRVDGCAAGTYYYHPRDHRLIRLRGRAAIDRSIHFPINQATYDEAAFSLFLVAQLSAMSPMYGARSRDFCLIEAGLMTQLLESSGPASQIGLCQIGQIRKPEILPDLLDLDASHAVVHTLVGGRLSAGGNIRRPWQTDDALVSDIRGFVEQKIPHYMVPSTFVLLDELPLSANGKVDRKALPDPDLARAQRERPYLAPRTDLERAIATVIAGLLHVDRVGLDDSFFELGADSLTVVKAHGELQALTDREFPLLALFEHPSVGALARHLSAATVAAAGFDESEERARRQQDAMRRQQQRAHQGKRELP